MSDRDPAQNQLIVTGFALFLFNILANTISTLDFDEFNGVVAFELKLTLLISVFSLVISIAYGAFAFAKITSVGLNLKSLDPAKSIRVSCDWLTLALVTIASTYSLIVTRSSIIAGIFLILNGFTFVYINRKKVR